jgi:hypothetical protein
MRPIRACQAVLVRHSIGNFEGDTLVVDTVGIRVGAFDD